MIKSFPKAFAIGTDYINLIFEGEVEITEKIDGSQFSFGKINNELFIRSKGAQLFVDNPQKMFSKGIDYVVDIQDKLPDNTIYYCEFLSGPSHNILQYERVPKNNLILFGMSDEKGNFKKEYEYMKNCANEINIDMVPLIYRDKIKNPDELLKLLEEESVLGGNKVEGIVVKNYSQPFLLGGQPIPIMMGKYVSEAFKETHRKKWGRTFTGKGKWQVFLESFQTEARWHKAIQHLTEKDELVNEPKDIGKLMKEIQDDIEIEEKENIKNFLWEQFKSDVFRTARRGFPEFYKKQLLKRNFDKQK